MTIRMVPTTEYPTPQAAYDACADYGDTILFLAEMDIYLSIRKLVNLIASPAIYNNNYNDFITTNFTTDTSCFRIYFHDFPTFPPDMTMLIEGFNTQLGGIAYLESSDTDLATLSNPLHVHFNRCKSLGSRLLFSGDANDTTPKLNWTFSNCEADKWADARRYSNPEAGSFLIVEKTAWTGASYYRINNSSATYVDDSVDNFTTPLYGVGSADTGEMYGSSVGDQIINEAYWSVSGQIQNIPLEVDTADFKVLLFQENPLLPNYPLGPLAATNINPDGTWEFSLLAPDRRYGVLINPPDGMKGHWLKWYNPAGS